MSVPAGRREQSRFEAAHQFYKLRDEVTYLIMMDFGFSKEKYEKQIERYAQAHRCATNIDDVVARYREKCERFQAKFIDKEADAVLEILRKIESEFSAGNAIHPADDNPAKIMEYCLRRKHMDEAISQCFVLKQELQYIIRTLPVDMNKFTRFAEAIDLQISLYKGVRQTDNRFLKPSKPKKPFNKPKASEVFTSEAL